MQKLPLVKSGGLQYRSPIGVSEAEKTMELNVLLVSDKPRLENSPPVRGQREPEYGHLEKGGYKFNGL